MHESWKRAVDLGLLVLDQINPHRMLEDVEGSKDEMYPDPIGKALIPVPVSNRFVCLDPGRK